MACVCLLVMPFAAYIPAIRGGFIWDDDAYVVHNQTLRSLDGLRRIWFEPMSIPQYYPLVHTSFWVEYQAWGLWPAGYHAVNVALHSLTSLMLYVVLRRLALPGAWLASALFAIHPVHVESVAWITERKNVLSGLFYVLSFLAYLRFLDARKTGARATWSWYLAACLLFIGAMLSKTVACSLPAAILLVHWWKQGRIGWRELAPTLPLFAVGLSLGLTTAYLERVHVGASGDEFHWTFLERCLIAGRALWFYAAKLLVPVRLTFFYPRWKIDATNPVQWAYPIGAMALVAALWFARHRLGRGPLVAVLFFGGTLFPALGFINVYPMRYSFVADHFQYLASIGILALFAAAISTAAFSAGTGGRSVMHGRKPLAAVGCALLLLAMGVQTWR
ncbi:MAG: O-GlcNAc transferase, partial [Planctomycetota bacterium]